MNPRKLDHGFRMISAEIPYTLPSGQEENDVPIFWHLLIIPSPSAYMMEPLSGAFVVPLQEPLTQRVLGTVMGGILPKSQ